MKLAADSELDDNHSLNGRARVTTGDPPIHLGSLRYCIKRKYPLEKTLRHFREVLE